MHAPLFTGAFIMTLDTESTDHISGTVGTDDSSPNNIADAFNIDDPCNEHVISLSDFVGEFGDDLLACLNSANLPSYTCRPRPHRVAVLSRLKRKLFPAQAEVVHA